MLPVRFWLRFHWEDYNLPSLEHSRSPDQMIMIRIRKSSALSKSRAIIYNQAMLIGPDHNISEIQTHKGHAIIEELCSKKSIKYLGLLVTIFMQMWTWSMRQYNRHDLETENEIKSFRNLWSIQNQPFMIRPQSLTWSSVPRKTLSGSGSPLRTSRRNSWYSADRKLGFRFRPVRRQFGGVSPIAAANVGDDSSKLSASEMLLFLARTRRMDFLAHFWSVWFGVRGRQSISRPERMSRAMPSGLSAILTRNWIPTYLDR